MATATYTVDLSVEGDVATLEIQCLDSSDKVPTKQRGQMALAFLIESLATAKAQESERMTLLRETFQAGRAISVTEEEYRQAESAEKGEDGIARLNGRPIAGISYESRYDDDGNETDFKYFVIFAQDKAAQAKSTREALGRVKNTDLAPVVRDGEEFPRASWTMKVKDSELLEALGDGATWESYR